MKCFKFDSSQSADLMTYNLIVFFSSLQNWLHHFKPLMCTVQPTEGKSNIADE